MSNPEILLFPHLPLVSLPSPALRPGGSRPPDTPFRSSPPTRYPYPLSTRKTPIRSNPSISFHILNIQPLLQPPYLTKKPPPHPFRLFSPVYKLLHVTDERALDLFRWC